MKPKRPYHHGDLKRALLDAALELVRTQGAEAFTLREVARRAGVSHNAPYRHFRDRGELLAAVAVEGYERLTQSMVKAAESATTPSDRFLQCGFGFLQFALRYPEHFKVIFDTPQRYEYPEARVAGERTFGTLLGYIRECQAAGVLPQDDARCLGLTYLGLVQGTAKLAITGRLPFSEVAEVCRFFEKASSALTRGFAQPATETAPEPVRSSPKKRGRP